MLLTQGPECKQASLAKVCMVTMATEIALLRQEAVPDCTSCEEEQALSEAILPC